MTYPQLVSPVAQFLDNHLAIGQSATDQLVLPENQSIEKSQSLTDQFIVPTTAQKALPILVDSFSIFNSFLVYGRRFTIPILTPSNSRGLELKLV